MYKIGEFSKMTKTTVKTLRFYEKKGLLKPEAKDLHTGYRMYTTAQLLKVHRIKSLRQTGLSIEDIKKVMENSDDFHETLERLRVDVAYQIAAKQDQLSRIDFLLSGKEEEEYMNYQATIKEVSECIVYSTEVLIEDYSDYFKVIPQIGEKVMNKYPDLKCAVPEYCFVRYLDGQYKERNFRIEFCEAVEKMWDDFDDIKFKHLEKTEVISVMHKGPYSELGKAYAFAMRWANENGYKINDCPRENYIDGIWNKDSEEDWLTEIQIPFERK